MLASNAYGKSMVRLVTIARSGARHDLRDLTVNVALAGEFTRAHTEGDNSAVLPTDTMKNAVYALARTGPLGEPEEFAARLARHCLDAAPAAGSARVHIAEHQWARLTVAGRAHDHAFRRAGPEHRLATVTATRRGLAVEAGISDLHVLKSAGSAFEGFRRDAYTTLRETSERIFATAIQARWRYAGDAASFGPLWHGVRRLLLETFAAHDSRSVQHTLYAMGEAVLAECAAVVEINLTLPNRHHLAVDLSPFGLDNPNEVFVATEAPYGLIEATLRRGA